MVRQYGFDARELGRRKDVEVVELPAAVYIKSLRRERDLPWVVSGRERLERKYDQGALPWRDVTTADEPHRGTVGAVRRRNAEVIARCAPPQPVLLDE
jgi:hypothetical protein